MFDFNSVIGLIGIILIGLSIPVFTIKNKIEKENNEEKKGKLVSRRKRIIISFWAIFGFMLLFIMFIELPENIRLNKLIKKCRENLCNKSITNINSFYTHNEEKNNKCEKVINRLYPEVDVSQRTSAKPEYHPLSCN